ncbi:RNA recognition motif-containing protein [Besnoitia besnoiti]|uniref:RNA recognition motif-containing protein n=1 Tax=Besnoitia besnoiti TaxID=94643 RepID=A0A2A9M414_BESBE|nr:RNA recognition motif-containing protein [Besnoitia besnoiti]PFH31964.1 RNA recognition motif-containing protein [Besnoitia besnoiti]
MDPSLAFRRAGGLEPAVGEKRKASALEEENAAKVLKTEAGESASAPSPGPLVTPSPSALSVNGPQQSLLSPPPPVLSSPYSPAPLSSPAAAFVAGAAAVTSVLSAPLLEKPQGLFGGGEDGALAPGVPGAIPPQAGSAAAQAGAPDSDEHAVDVARAAAAAAAAVSARQAAANSAARALQMAMKTAELLQGPAGSATGMNVPGSELNTQSRHARKVYVGNLPVPVTQPEVQQYFNELLNTLLPNKVPGDTIVHVYVNAARRFAFLEHRSIEEANFTLGLDGVSWRNCALSLRRPQDYNPTLAEQQYKEERARLGSLTGFAVPPPNSSATPSAPAESSLIAGALGIVSTTVPDSPHKIFVGGLPHSITEQGCKQLLEAFGQLRALHVVKDQQRGDCKGFAFCEYLDPNVTDVAVAGLNNMRIADRVLQVRRAMPHGHVKAGGDGGVVSPAPAAPSIVGTLSKVIAIHNMLPPLPLVPPLLREATASEARIRASPYGEILFVDVLENLATSAAAKGEGVPVLVEFRDVDSAIQAMAGIQGSTYDGRSLSVVFAEPSAAMKKAAVLRIIQEAGGPASANKSSSVSPPPPPPVPADVSAATGGCSAATLASSGAPPAAAEAKTKSSVAAAPPPPRSPEEAAAAGSAAVAALLFGGGPASRQSPVVSIPEKPTQSDGVSRPEARADGSRASDMSRPTAGAEDADAPVTQRARAAADSEESGKAGDGEEH